MIKDEFYNKPLTESEKKIVWDLYIEGYSYNQIAMNLHCNPNIIYNYISFEAAKKHFGKKPHEPSK
jgi:hypothetical protein